MLLIIFCQARAVVKMKKHQMGEKMDEIKKKIMMKRRLNRREKNEPEEMSIGTWLLLFAVMAIIGFNQVVIGQISTMSMSTSRSNINAPIALSGDVMQDTIGIVISQGVPEIYGNELVVSFDDAVGSMEVLKNLDPTYGRQKIVLQGADLERYINIGSMIACEYCCGAKTIVFKNGEASCGCKHSWAMRGLAAYLIQNHGDEYTDDEIIRELAKWKSLYFPKQMIQKFMEQMQTGEYTTDIASMVMGFDEKTIQALGGDGSVTLPSEIENLPGMVGGC